ncbi:MAG: XRE family transcriptional regulator [Oceanicoccus sp.]|uniref:hypothetical protein n=1 Tax=Oceanicoccus sp. TaxID=2691044 RepID=UPI00261CC834|nr:hypothetical protein [Oceanicoccus sp.]MCP3908302.1 XRE family transcriptional regulator [Oceanicoccus sp.]MDG1772619.1 hypothetical protein [Oceanicoccus sp.]
MKIINVRFFATATPKPDIQLAENRRKQSITKVALAKALETSRSGLDRLLDPKDTKVTLGSLAKVAQVVGKRMEIRFV